METVNEKLINGLNEEQWKDRFVAYMKKRSNIKDWQARESADIAWDESIDETPEECAQCEMECWS